MIIVVCMLSFVGLTGRCFRGGYDQYFADFDSSILEFSIISGTVGFSRFFPALSKPVVVAWLIFGLLPKPWRSQ
jgi:hypothetical protein